MYVVILAGGSGTRFWPLSRSTRPKQLVSIDGGPSMLQQTVERVLPLKPKRIMVVTNCTQVAETEQQLAHYRKVPIDIVAEPCARNTAPAVGLAATLIAAHDPEGVMVVLPADHFIRDREAFAGAVTAAIHSARNGYLATLGIVPTRPETGYGYIEADMELRGAGPFPVVRFVEKPPLEQAVQYVQDGRFFWNSGMFAWRADTILQEIGRYRPSLAESLQRIELAGTVWELADLETQIAAVYDDVEGISIDYAVMEHSRRVQVVPAEMGWSDVGSWSALPEIAAADDLGNVAVGASGCLAIDARDNIVYSDGRLVALLGVSDVVVVSTPDALLLCDRARCQDVRYVVERLGQLGHDKLL